MATVPAVALSQALYWLSVEDAKRAEIATLRLFADLTLQQVAEVTGTTVPTTHRRWVYAKAFLRKELAT